MNLFVFCLSAHKSEDSFLGLFRRKFESKKRANILYYKLINVK
ncbi:hypothetical protein LEP1GSC137_0486 [Leptospira borgpetersenii str. Noumea 25]|nr:hypothetical protein LEP1GSC137_0486 [Leptospira borgpetersenii str. Noumea 25]